MKIYWKCLNYSTPDVKKEPSDDLRAMLLNEWASCRLEKPPKEFGKFVVAIIIELKNRGIDPTAYIG